MSGPLPLADRVRAGDIRAIARAISIIEDESPQAAALVRDLFAHTGRSYLVGITGPPGAGKSTLVDRLTSETRKAGETVGVVAVDPTSPFTGGAILGDRVRMQAHHDDPDVFIRSMATRGHMGGLARASSDVALVLDASGKSLVIIETVGVGQDEVDIVRTADISIVVLVPGTGDDVQALKAGIMEIADIYVVNKADRDGAERMVTSIESNLVTAVVRRRGVAPADPEDGSDHRPRHSRAVADDSGLPDTLRGFSRPAAEGEEPVPSSRSPHAPVSRVRGEDPADARGVRRADRPHCRAGSGSVFGGRGHSQPEPSPTMKVWIDHLGIAVQDVAADARVLP